MPRVGHRDVYRGSLANAQHSCGLQSHKEGVAMWCSGHITGLPQNGGQVHEEAGASQPLVSAPHRAVGCAHVFGQKWGVAFICGTQDTLNTGVGQVIATSVMSMAGVGMWVPEKIMGKIRGKILAADP